MDMHTPRVIRDPAMAIREARRVFFERGDIPRGLVNDKVLDSWQRCRACGIDPGRKPGLDGASREALNTALDRDNALMRAARPVVDAMAAQTDGDPNLILLTDAEGLILMVGGNREFAVQARRRDLRTGMTLGETIRGTNAPGACLLKDEPLIVHGGEHYRASDALFTCSSAPIHGPHGAVIGAIDITGDARVLQPYPVAFPLMAAELIEHQLFRLVYPLQMLLRFHTRLEYVGTVGEGLAVLSSDGSLVAVNRSGLRLLGCNDADLRGRAFDAIFDARFSELCSLIRRAVQPVIRLQLQNGTRIYARIEGGEAAPVAAPDTAKPAAAPVPDAGSLRQIECDAVRGALEAEHGNVSAAARRLGIARTTLYRKLKQRGTAAQQSHRT